MTSIPKACVSCSLNCLTRHKRKNDDPSTVTSFFKIMFGKNILNYLVLPPIISKMLASLVGKWILLEDSNRRKWDVRLVIKDGSLAFQKGWHDFVLDHNIEMGDFVVFYFIKDAHLLVEIYGRSGCPKVLNTDKNRTNDTSDSDSLSFIPKSRPSDPVYKQRAHKRSRNERYMNSRHVPTRGEFSGKTPRRDKHGPKVVPDDEFMTSRNKTRPRVASDDEFMTSRDKTRPKVVPDDEFMTSRDKTRPKVAPVAESEVDPWLFTHKTKTRTKVVRDGDFTTNRDKTKAKVSPAVETEVGPWLNTNRDKSRPKVAPVVETEVDPWVIPNRNKTRPKVAPEVETEVDPWSVPDREDFEFQERTPWVDSCSVSHREKHGPKIVQDDEIMRPNVVPIDETEVGDPCFMTRPEKSNVVNDNRDVLFDLSRFEMPVKKSNSDKEEETDYGQDVSIASEDSADDLIDLPDWVMPETEITNASDEGQPDGKLQCQESEKKVQQAESLKPKVNVPLDSILPPEVDQKLAQLGSGEKMQVSNHQETNVRIQKCFGDAEGESSVDAKLFMGEKDLGDHVDSSVHLMDVVKGEKMQVGIQETNVVNQKCCGDPGGESSVDAKLSMGGQDLGNHGDSSVQVMNIVKDEKMQVRIQETNVRNQNFCGDAEGESSVDAKLSMGGQDLVDHGDSSVGVMNIVKGEKMQVTNHQETNPRNQNFCGDAIAEDESSVDAKLFMGGQDLNVVKDDLMDLPDWVMPETEITNASDEGQPDGNLQCQESEKVQHASNGAASIDFLNFQMSEENPDDVLSDSSPKVNLLVDSILPPEGDEKSAQSGSGEKIQLSNHQETNLCNQKCCGDTKLSMDEQDLEYRGEKTQQARIEETNVLNQKFCGDAEGESSVDAKLCTGEQDLVDRGDSSVSVMNIVKGEKMQLSNHQETNCGDVIAEGESCVDAKLSMGGQDLGDHGESSIHLMKVVKGEKTQPSNQRMKTRSQEIRGNAEVESSVDAKFPNMDDQNSEDQGNQKIRGYAEGRSLIGTKFSTRERNSLELGNSSIHLMNVKGGNMGRVKPESGEAKQNIYSDAIADCVYGEQAKISSGINVAENFSGMVKTEANLNIVVKQEPEDYEDPPEDYAAASPATVVEIICSVPLDTEEFLVLPEPLNLARRINLRRKSQRLPQQQLVHLKDHEGKRWPVLYHPKHNLHVLTSGWKEFMKATNIQPGDECIFTAKNSGDNVLDVQVVRHF